MEWLLFYGSFDGEFGFWFNWISNIFTFAAIQGIAICYLRKKQADNILYLDSDSAFISTSDIKNLTLVKSAIDRFYNLINRVWQQNIESRYFFNLLGNN